MNELLSVKVPWTPRAKGRPRHTKTGITYTDPKTREAEAAFAAAFEEAVGLHGSRFDEPIGMKLELANDFVIVSFTQEEDYTQRKLRGDLDNYVKLISDSLNGVAYTDDRLIVKLEAVKL